LYLNVVYEIVKDQSRVNTGINTGINTPLSIRTVRDDFSPMHKNIFY